MTAVEAKTYLDDTMTIAARVATPPPPEDAVAHDKFLLGAEMAFESKDYPKVLEYVRRLEELGGNLPSIVVYYRGESSFHTGRPGEAVRSLNRYVAEAGREGEHYRRALGLLLELDDRDDAAYARAEAAARAAERERRVLCGGSWSYSWMLSRSALRFRFETGPRLIDVGFRIARTLD